MNKEQDHLLQEPSIRLTTPPECELLLQGWWHLEAERGPWDLIYFEVGLYTMLRDGEIDAGEMHVVSPIAIRFSPSDCPPFEVEFDLLGDHLTLFMDGEQSQYRREVTSETEP